MSQVVSAVLLDLDDTLSDHTHSARAALAALRERYPALAAFGLDELAKIQAKNLEETHVRVLNGELTVEAARLVRFRALCATCGAHELDPSELAEGARLAYLAARRAVPGALELLRALRAAGVTIGIVTNNVLTEQVGKLRELGMTELIDVLVVSEEAGAKKPEPGIFRIALDRCGASADRAVMLGDSWPFDVLGARAAGIRAVWLNRNGGAVPDPTAAASIASLLPTDRVVELLLRG
jgi:putative hydrolase of the HAD superfamily